MLISFVFVDKDGEKREKQRNQEGIKMDPFICIMYEYCSRSDGKHCLHFIAVVEIRKIHYCNAALNCEVSKKGLHFKRYAFLSQSLLQLLLKKKKNHSKGINISRDLGRKNNYENFQYLSEDVFRIITAVGKNHNNCSLFLSNIDSLVNIWHNDCHTQTKC